MDRHNSTSSLAAIEPGEADEAAERRPYSPSTLPRVIGRASAGTGQESAWRNSYPLPSDDQDGNDDDILPRVRGRVPLQRGLLPASPLKRGLLLGTLIAASIGVGLAGLSAWRFFRRDPLFRIESVSSIQLIGATQVTQAQLLSVFGADIGRNLFFVPLGEREKELEEIPWVKRATVMRLLPNRLRVSIVQRTPIAFVRHGNSIGLVDADGVLLKMSPSMVAIAHYSFPVVIGIRPKDPISLRAARMDLYERFLSDLDSGGEKVSSRISEVDLSDPDDLRAFLPANGAVLLLHFGDSAFLMRYRRYQRHLAEWVRDYPHLASVDLRYSNQVVLGMDGNDAAQKSAPPAAPAKPLKKAHARRAASRRESTRSRR